jgi:hypothetical protein
VFWTRVRDTPEYLWRYHEMKKTPVSMSLLLNRALTDAAM